MVGWVVVVQCVMCRMVRGSGVTHRGGGGGLGMVGGRVCCDGVGGGHEDSRSYDDVAVR